MEEDAIALCGGRYERSERKSADRWGRTKGKIDFHGGKLEVERPRVRARSGGELGLPAELRRSLACTNIIENMNGTIRQVCRNVKHWQDASMALRWTGAAMQEAAKGFRRLKAYRQLPLLREALARHQAKYEVKTTLDRHAVAA